MQFDNAGLQDFAARYTAAWCSQDPARLSAFYSPDGSLTINSGAPAVGRTAIAEVARSFMTAFPDMRVSMDDSIVRGDRAEYHWTLTGTNTGAEARVIRFASVAPSFGRSEPMGLLRHHRADSMRPIIVAKLQAVIENHRHRNRCPPSKYLWSSRSAE